MAGCTGGERKPDTLVNPCCTIAHDCVLEDPATLGPSVAFAGRVHLASRVLTGTGGRVIPRLRIGRGAILGAGAVDLWRVAAGDVVVGVPALSLRRPVSPDQPDHADSPMLAHRPCLAKGELDVFQPLGFRVHTDLQSWKIYKGNDQQCFKSGFPELGDRHYG